MKAGADLGTPFVRPSAPHMGAGRWDGGSGKWGLLLGPGGSGSGSGRGRGSGSGGRRDWFDEGGGGRAFGEWDWVCVGGGGGGLVPHPLCVCAPPFYSSRIQHQHQFYALGLSLPPRLCV